MMLAVRVAVYSGMGIAWMHASEGAIEVYRVGDSDI